MSSTESSVTKPSTRMAFFLQKTKKRNICSGPSQYIQPENSPVCLYIPPDHMVISLQLYITWSDDQFTVYISTRICIAVIRVIASVLYYYTSVFSHCKGFFECKRLLQKNIFCSYKTALFVQKNSKGHHFGDLKTTILMRK